MKITFEDLDRLDAEVIAPITDAFHAVADDEIRASDLAVVFHEGKGEPEMTHAIFHGLRRAGVPVARERKRVDLVVDGVGTEWKTIHPYALLTEKRAPESCYRSFNDFAVDSSDLDNLRSGDVGALVAVVPHLLDRPHEKFGSYVHPSVLTNFGYGVDDFTSVMTSAAADWAEKHRVRLARQDERLIGGDGDRVLLGIVTFTMKPLTDQGVPGTPDQRVEGLGRGRTATALLRFSVCRTTAC